jgi:hypothetical protein
VVIIASIVTVASALHAPRHAANRIVETTDPRSAEIRKSDQTEEVLLC